MQLHGAWPAAIEEARKACELLSRPSQPALGLAFYQLGELHRVHGESRQAENAYREASGRGHEPQPGLSLLRLAQGRIDVAAAAIRRAVDEAMNVQGPGAGVPRAKLLGPYVEIMLAARDVDAARAAADELRRTAADLDAPFLHATSSEATGAVLVAEGRAGAGLEALRESSRVWQELDAPYEAARARTLMGVACGKLGDHDGAEMHFDAARAVFRQLGAVPDLARVDQLAKRSIRAVAGGLTAREVQVLRLVAAGSTNRQIADALVISERTVARHVANMFTKLGVSTRTAASAFAFKHGLA
jgi:DNA-binding NarL/FixJ family response regulator